MGKISLIHIENFRNHKYTEISSIGNFLALVGKNDIGKTSILDAIGISLGKANAKIEDFPEDSEKITIKNNFGEYCKTIKIEGHSKNRKTYVDELSPDNIKFPEYFLFRANEQYQDSEINNYSIDEFILTIENQIKRYAKYNIFLNYNYPTDDIDNNSIEFEIDWERKCLIESLDRFNAAIRLKEFFLLISDKYFNNVISNSLCFIPYDNNFTQERSVFKKNIQNDFNSWVENQSHKEELNKDFKLLSKYGGLGIYCSHDLLMQKINNEYIGDIFVIKSFDDIENVIKNMDNIIEIFDKTIKSKTVILKLLNRWRNLILSFKSYNDNIKIGKHGSGVRRICTIYNDIIQCIMKGKNNTYIFAIDEPEISLHPEQQRKFIKILKDVSKDFKNIQIIIATHSPYIVNELDTKEIYILKHKIDENGNELPEITPILPQERVLKNYDSLAEINYLAFDEVSKDYHIELFGYIHNKLIDNYDDIHNTIFKNDWDSLQKKDITGTLVPAGNVGDIAAVDSWLVNENDISNFKNKVDNNNDWYKYDKNRKRYILEKRTLPHCVRNNIDHPLIDCSNEVAKKNNAKYNDLDLIRESIEIMRKAITDNNL